MADWFLKEKSRIEKYLCHVKTQKVVKSETINTLGEKVDMLICSTPIEEAAEIYSMLNYKPIPFLRIKIRRTQQT